MAKKTTTRRAKISAKSIIDELKTPGLLIVGIVGGSMAGKMIDKVVKVDTTSTDFQAKKIVKPLVQITAGVGGALLLKDKNLKLIASGIAATGIASTVKVFLKKDLLQGLAQFAGLGEAVDGNIEQVFREPVNLKIAAYNPDLPALSSAAGGYAELPVETDFAGTELGAYQEIQEVEIL